METAYIVDAVRTPRARKKKEFKNVHPIDLFTYPLNALKDRQSFNPADIDDVVAGCVTQYGEQAWCVSRGAVLAAGWPETVPASTVNRLCGSGQQACNFVSACIQSGQYRMAIGGGLEHMTRVPMFSDTGGEESPLLKSHYPDLVHQGLAAEILCDTYSISRNQIDEFSVESQKRAATAMEEGRFNKGLIPVPYLDDDGKEHTLTQDTVPRPSTTLEGLSELDPVFKDDGVITAGNASAICDGAAAVLYASDSSCKKYGFTPRAKILSTAVIGSPPKIMLTGPVAASQKALKNAGLEAKDICLWEINEAFAPVPVMTMNELSIPWDRVNVNGGGISLGHPLGATGAMLIGTALDELERQDKTHALITMCIGLGMGIATIIERV